MRKRYLGWLLAAFLVVSMVEGSGPGVPDTPPTTPTAPGSGPGGADVSDHPQAFRGAARGEPVQLPQSVDLGLEGVPRDDPAVQGVSWPQPARVRELPDQRTSHGKFFQLSDGRVEAEISQVPVHYRDKGGVWQPIDTTVRPGDRAGFVAGNTTNSFESQFGTTSDRLARFEFGGRFIELGLAGPPVALTPRVDGSTVTFAGVAGGADLVYEVTPGGLKENLVLARPPAGNFNVTFTLNTGGLRAVQLDDGSIAFTRPDGGPVLFTMPAPFMFDSRLDAASATGTTMSDQVRQVLVQHGATATITVSADVAWLADPARVYPVTIDPSVKIQPGPTDGQDVQIYSGATATNYNSTYQLKVGTDTTQMWRTLVKFPLTGVPTNTVLDSAKLEMFYSQTHTAWGYDVAMEARRVTQPWTESTATWSNMSGNIAAQPAGNMVRVDDGDAGTSVVGTWPYSTNAALTPFAINADYRFNNDTTTGHTHTWVPTITEAGDYQVEAHFVTESDRPTNAPYTVYYAGGQKTYLVDQTGGPNGEWKTLGVHPFAAGTTGRVVLGDVSGKAAIADAVRFTRWGVATKKRAISSVWSSFPVRNVVQEWVNGTQPNHGFMVKAVDETPKGRGGPIFEAAEFFYRNGGRDYNLPKLILTWGRPGVTVAPPTTVTATGAALSWSAYVDPSTAPGDNLVEYQVHRSLRQTFTPSAATLVAPLAPGTLSYQDTTATPTAADTPDTELGRYYYYMVAVKTADGQIIAAPTEGVRLPKAGRITRIFRTGTVDTTLSQARPDTNVDVYDGDPYVSPGNNSSYYGDTRGLVKFPTLTGIPTGSQVVSANLRMWANLVDPGTSAGDFIDVHRLTRAFTETTATWNRANSTTPWTTPGGDFDPVAMSGQGGLTNDPEWQSWDVRPAVNGWLANSASNFGLLLKMRSEAVATGRTMLLSSEGAEPMLRPTLEVTYLEPTPASTYHAQYTPSRMIPGDLYTIPVTVSNPTLTSWNAADWELSYHWALPDGTDVTNSGNQLATPLPKTIVPGDTVDISAQVRTPIQSDSGNKRTDYVLRWELHNKTTNQWLSQVAGIASLDQPVAVEDPTSDQLGLEKFYQYAGMNTGAGGTVMNNLYAGNTVFSYNAFTNPSRGLATFVRLAYNSQDTSGTVAGYGWSLQASSLMRLGTPLDFHPNPNPTTVTLTDGDGTSHIFSWDPIVNEWKAPAGVHLFLQRLVVCDQQTEQDRAWSMTRPDRTQFFYDCDGYLSAVEDNNGNTMTFTYEVRRSQNKPTKFLRYITDPVGRQTLTINYWAKGDTYDLIDEVTWAKVTGQPNLTNPHIVDRVRSITDISGRTLTLTYTVKGLLGELIDGAGSAQPKVFGFRYDMTQGNKNVKLVRVTDPRGNATNLAYYSNPEDDPKFKWNTRTYTDRLGNPTTFGYTDPDGSAGSFIRTVVTDAENHATTCLIDGFGRPTEVTDAKTQTTRLGWDADNNVVRLEEPNTAVRTWTFDQKTGYPTQIKDAEAVANNWTGITLAYQTGLNGHIADLIAKQSSEGRRWTFTHSLEGDLASVTDPVGNTTPDPSDHTATYTYDTWGQLQTATDANGHTTTHADFHDSGYPRTITDPQQHATRFVYDIRGQVTSVTDALGHASTQAYDTFGRPLEQTVPKDQAAGIRITTPAPEYDANDNMLRQFAPNGAVKQAVFDNADQLSYTLDPKDEPTDPERRTSFTYDRVGNQLTATEPKGNLTPTAGDFTTTNTYDEIYQLVAVANANGERISSTYDNVGNITQVVDARKNATPDPNDFTARRTYDRNHRPRVTTDALGHTTSTEYDRDGLAVATTDEEGNRSTVTYDARGLVVEEKVPHRDNAGTIVYRLTRYEYDEVGNRTKVITPRGVDTPTVADDFTYQTVYDELNRAKEEWKAYDPGDPRYNQPDKTIYSYDQVGRLSTVSAPPSSGESVRNDSRYTYWDNGWTKTTTDPWDIVTEYDYNLLGQQTRNKLTTGGGCGPTGTACASRTMTWDFYLSGNLRSRSDDGLPAGRHVVLVDSSDFNNTTSTGTWPAATSGTGYQGHNYHTHAAGTGANSFTWNLTVPQDGSYDVYVKYPAVSGAASNAPFTVNHAGGSTAVPVNQTTNAGNWVSLGRFTFTAGGSNQKVTLTDNANGTVVADAVKLVRDTTGEADNESKTITYTYDPNGNVVQVRDTSPGTSIDTYATSYDGLNQVSKVEEKAGTTVKNTTSFSYDPNGNVLTRTHDATWSQFEYDARDLLSKVTNAATPSAADKRITTFTYTPRSLPLRQVKPNGNTVDYSYYLDGSIRNQVEKRSGGAIVAEHTLDYTANGDPSRDVAKVMNADNSSAYVDNTYNFSYDPQDRIARVEKTGASPTVETYVHDANNNVIQQTVKNVTTNHDYDRNRLLRSTAVGGLTSVYNYDPIGRLDTVTTGGVVSEKYRYDGFDRIAELRSGSGASAKTTRYVYDPFDRTARQTSNVGGANEKTTVFGYLGTSSDVVTEFNQTAGRTDKSYEYSVGQKLTQFKHKDDGTKEISQYVYHPKGDVEAITKQEDGTTRATYGYTAYGEDDDSKFTGVDKPDPQNPEAEPYNPYRFNGHRFDKDSGTYDMGFRNYDPGLNQFLSRDMYSGALADLTLAVDPFTGSRYAFAGGNPISNIEIDGHGFGDWVKSAASAVADTATAVVDHIKEDPLQFAAEVAVGVAAAAAVGTFCAATAGIGCVIAAGAVAGAASAGAGYGIDVAQGEHDWNTGDFLKTVAIGGVIGGATAGLGRGAGNLGRRLTGRGPAARTGPGAAGLPDGQPPARVPAAGAPEPTPTGGARPTAPARPAPAPARPAAAKPAGCNSFVAGTAVLMADGSAKPIEQIELGERVWATDPESGRTEQRPVTALIDGDGDKQLVELTVDPDGPGGEPAASIVATDGHPFWVPALREWVDAGELHPGHWLRTSTGTWIQLTAVKRWAETTEVHNLTIADIHTYYVLVAGVPVLVHNAGACPRDARGRFTSGENVDAARGRATHQNYRTALGDAYDYEVTLPSGRRPDAIDWANSVVRELKSDAPSSMATGRRQLRGYVAELEEMTGRSWTGVLDVYKRH